LAILVIIPFGFWLSKTFKIVCIPNSPDGIIRRFGTDIFYKIYLYMKIAVPWWKNDDVYKKTKRLKIGLI
jgi:hypothetical protein